jgi:2,4-dienoyl-CoA reductase-like NADH-dependent reductase (Old Yellow Enzyme family)
MNKLFEPAKLGSLTIKNWLVRSATFEFGCTEHGRITPKLTAVHTELASGGTGLIITGMMGVSPNAEINDAMVKIYDKSFVKDFSELVDAVHKAGGKIVVQLGHCGAKAKVITRGDHPYAPSDIQLENSPAAKAMTRDEIGELVKDYGRAALRCRESGADGVQLHGAHGYLVSEFLSPYFNKRDDEYGGSIENRARLLFEIYDEIRRSTGDFPLLIKINYSDLVEPGITPEEAVWVCGELSKRGIDAIEVSAGVSLSGGTRPSKTGFKAEGYFGEWAIHVASAVSVSVIAMGGFRTPEVMETLLNKSAVEAIALCRPLIREPDLPNRWERDPLTKTACISCNQCYSSPVHGCFLEQNREPQKGA